MLSSSIINTPFLRIKLYIQNLKKSIDIGVLSILFLEQYKRTNHERLVPRFYFISLYFLHFLYNTTAAIATTDINAMAYCSTPALLIGLLAIVSSFLFGSFGSSVFADSTVIV